ncbi:hypothetical protein R1flu_014624 [Riccia fluitans]|uniref:Uncharacterized protein n=1 Tax=Riccia fluitans TaxID=41844 RepID=A0ABD1YGW7_9MARC
MNARSIGLGPPMIDATVAAVGESLKFGSRTSLSVGWDFRHKERPCAGKFVKTSRRVGHRLDFNQNGWNQMLTAVILQWEVAAWDSLRTTWIQEENQQPILTPDSKGSRSGSADVEIAQP